MTDIFFSYSSVDRERVRPIRDALVAQGFEVFWDQQVPTGLDWDSWIRQHLAKSKCAMAFWSAASVASDNVRHEATVAKQQGKLISVLLEPLTAEQFPMGLYAQQAANLSNWNGDQSGDEWRKFRREYEAKLTPLWVRRQIDELEAELVGERARREGAERRDRVLQAQIAKEAETQQELKRERDQTLDEVAALKATLEEATRARSEVEAKQTEARLGLKRERDQALDEVAALKATLEEATRARSDAEARVINSSRRLSKVRQSKAKEIARAMGATLSPLVIAAAVATVGFWTYQLIWSAPRPLLAVTNGSTPEAEQQRLAAIKEEEQRQAKAAADVEAKLKAAEAEQQRLKDEVQRQAKAAADADAKRRTAEAEQQRLKEELQRQAKAATDADAKRTAAEPASQSSPAAVKGLFEIRRNMEAARFPSDHSSPVKSIDECEQKCTQSASCNAFAFDKRIRSCYLYSRADLVPNANFNSGIRIGQSKSNPGAQSVTSASAAVQPSAARSFTIRSNTEAISDGEGGSAELAPSLGGCEEKCTQSPTCKIFTYLKSTGQCYLYPRATFIQSDNFDSGIRN